MEKIVIGNWKMNPLSEKEARSLVTKTKKISAQLKKTAVVLCPPALYISPLAKERYGKRISLGAQDGYFMPTGAVTGSISTDMLKQYKVSHVIVGHSERRAAGETDDHVAKKIDAALKLGVTPILCIGERERDIEGTYLSFLKKQLHAALVHVSKKQLEDIIIAYEPVWAIGKSARQAMSPHQVHETVLLIRKILTEKFGGEAAKKSKIIYGGSVEESNAAELMEAGHVSGFLVGHTSLVPEKFKAIISAVEDSEARHA